MNSILSDISPYYLFIFIGLFAYYCPYAISYAKEHTPPEGTPRWVFRLNVVFVRGILVVLMVGFPAFTTWMWSADVIQRWEEFVVPWLQIALTVCLLGQAAIYYYYKFYPKFKK